eukprot:PhM_4_TR13230/c0_g1_i1/m.78903
MSSLYSSFVIFDFNRLRQFWHPYYAINVAVCASYFVFARNAECMRNTPHSHDLFFPDSTGWTREVQIFGSLAVLVASRLLSGRLVEDVLPLAFQMCKVAILICSLIVSYTVPAGFAVLFSLVWAFVYEPEYRGVSRVSVIPAHAYSDVIEKYKDNKNDTKEEKQKKSKVKYLVVLHGAMWSPPSTRFVRHFAMLADAWASSEYVFFRADIGRNPHLATTLGIDAGGSSRQVPTVIKYKASTGQEVCRVPVKDDNTFRTKYLHEYTRAELEQALGMEGKKS